MIDLLSTLILKVNIKEREKIGKLGEDIHERIPSHKRRL
jgi:hypothetical protein